MTNTAFTVNGTAVYETGVSLTNLNVGDLVLGTPEPGRAARTLHEVTEPYGKHKVPFEEPPSWFERTFLAGSKQTGVLVQTVGAGTPAMFVEETTPVIDRVTGWIGDEWA